MLTIAAGVTIDRCTTALFQTRPLSMSRPCATCRSSTMEKRGYRRVPRRIESAQPFVSRPLIDTRTSLPYQLTGRAAIYRLRTPRAGSLDMGTGFDAMIDAAHTRHFESGDAHSARSGAARTRQPPLVAVGIGAHARTAQALSEPRPATACTGRSVRRKYDHRRRVSFRRCRAPRRAPRPRSAAVPAFRAAWHRGRSRRAAHPARVRARA